MIETEQSILIDAPISIVWHYVQDVSRWANLFPGCRECTVISDRDSHWVLKVGAGGLVRTVNVLVHVEEWTEPERVDFTFKLDGDPVEGGGAYVAKAQSDNETEVSLRVRVEGSGKMAPLWEALSKPLLPQLAKSFAGKLKADIEKPAEVEAPLTETTEKSSPLAAMGKELRNL